MRAAFLVLLIASLLYLFFELDVVIPLIRNVRDVIVISFLAFMLGWVLVARWWYGVKKKKTNAANG